MLAEYDIQKESTLHLASTETRLCVVCEELADYGPLMCGHRWPASTA